MVKNRYKELREEFSLTQKQLAEILDLTPAAIGLYEQGRREPDLETLEKMAECFSVSIDYLLCRTSIRKLDCNDIEHFEKFDASNFTKAFKIIKRKLNKTEKKYLQKIINELHNVINE